MRHHRVLAIAILATACSNNNNPTTNNHGASPGLAPQAAPVVLNDAQIAAVSDSLNNGEIAVAQAAQPKLGDPRAVAFATQMIDDHTAAKQQQAQLLLQLGLTPAPSQVSQNVDQEAQAVINQLNQGHYVSATGPTGPTGGAPGPGNVCGITDPPQPDSGQAASTYDCAYASSQVQMHERALSLLDNTLLPQVSNADLKTLLQTMRATVLEHLQTAQNLAGIGNNGDVAGGIGGTTGPAGIPTTGPTGPTGTTGP